MSLSLVEEIEQLQNCQTHQECAQWLLTCPYSKLMTYEMAIRARLRTRGFLEGIEYLDKELRRLRAPRWDGEFDERNGHGRQTMMLYADGHLPLEEDQPFPPVGGEGEPI